MLPFNPQIQAYYFWKSYSLLSQEMQYHLQPINHLECSHNIFTFLPFHKNIINSQDSKQYCMRMPYDLDNLIEQFTIAFFCNSKDNRIIQKFRHQLQKQLKNWRDSYLQTSNLIKNNTANLQIKKIDAVLQVIEGGQGNYKTQTVINMIAGIDQILIKWFKRIIGSQLNSYRLYHFMRLFDLQLLRWQPSIIVFQQFQLDAKFGNLYIDILFLEHRHLRTNGEESQKELTRLCLNSLTLSPIADTHANLNDSVIGSLINQISMHENQTKVPRTSQNMQKVKVRVNSQSSHSEHQNKGLVKTLKKSDIMLGNQSKSKLTRLKSQNENFKINIIRNFFKAKNNILVNQNTNSQRIQPETKPFMDFCIIIKENLLNWLLN